MQQDAKPNCYIHVATHSCLKAQIRYCPQMLSSINQSPNSSQDAVENTNYCAVHTCFMQSHVRTAQWLLDCFFRLHMWQCYPASVSFYRSHRWQISQVAHLHLATAICNVVYESSAWIAQQAYATPQQQPIPPVPLGDLVQFSATPAVLLAFTNVKLIALLRLEMLYVQVLLVALAQIKSRSGPVIEGLLAHTAQQQKRGHTKQL